MCLLFLLYPFSVPTPVLPAGVVVPRLKLLITEGVLPSCFIPPSMFPLGINVFKAVFSY